MKLRGKKIVVLVADGFEDLEYWVTVMRLQEEGAEVISVGPNEGSFSGKNALEATADITADRVDAPALRGDHRPRQGGPREGQDGRHHLSRWTRRNLRWYCGRCKCDGLHGDQGRPHQRWGYLGGQACVPRGQPRLGSRRGGHPGLLPRADGRSFRGVERNVSHTALGWGLV